MPKDEATVDTEKTVIDKDVKKINFNAFKEMSFKELFDYLMRYAFSSVCAVLFDIALYAALVHFFAIPPFYANVISSITSVVVVWFLSGKLLFAEHKITWRGYVTWYVYQFFAILVYSAMIKGLIFLGTHYLLSKVIVTGVSFLINSIFFKLIVLKKH